MKEDIVYSFTESVKKSDLSNIATTGSEIVLNSILEKDLLKEIPVFKSMINIYEGINQIREDIFIKKIYKFLFEINDISVEKRNKMIEKLGDEISQKKAGETIIVLLDRLDNMEKPTIIGRLFRSFIEEKIDYKMFLRLSSIIDRSFLPDLKKIADNYPNPSVSYYLSNIEKEIMYNLGILSTNIINKKETDKTTGLRNKNSGSLEYEINKFGKKLIEYGFQIEKE